MRPRAGLPSRPQSRPVLVWHVGHAPWDLAAARLVHQHMQA